MSRGACLLALLFALIALLGSVPARADDGREGEARVLFERAAERLRAGQFAEARDLLNQSLALARKSATAFNLSVAYRGTGESMRAAELLRRLQSGEYGQLETAQRREVRELLRAVEAEIGTLEVEARGAAEVQIRIDGRQVGNLAEGARGSFKSDAGERLVTASATDRVTAERRVRVQRGKRVRISFELHATPEARFGTIVLVAPGRADTLEIIGVASARGRLERDVKPGRYRVRLAGEHGTRETTLSVSARSVVRYEFDEARETSLWKSPIFWASAAGAVAAATLGVILVVGRPRDDPVRDSEFGVVEALTPR